MSVIVRQISRHPVTGLPNNGVAIDLVREFDGSTLATDTTGADGMGEFTQATIGGTGYPGPLRAEQTVGSTDLRRTGWETGQMGGLMYELDIPDVLEALGIGVIPNVGGELAVTASGAGMVVAVATGAAVVQGGFPFGLIPFVRETAGNVSISAADPTNPRIDRVVLRVTREAQSEQGKILLTTISGTPAASPIAPSLTQSSVTYDYSLAQVLVGAGVSSIASDKVTDERYSVSLNQAFAFGRPTGLRAGDLLYINASGKLTRLPVGSNGQRLVLASGLPTWTQELGGATLVFGNGLNVIDPATIPDQFFTIPYAATFVRWQCRSTVASSTIAFDIDKAASGSSSYSSIDGSEIPTLTAAQTSEDSSLTTWTTAIAARDNIRISAASSPSVVNATQAQVYLEWVKV